VIDITRRKTKVVWSIEARSFNQRVLDLINEHNVDAVRIEFGQSCLEDTYTFLKGLNPLTKPKRTPVMLDVTPPARGRIFNLKAPKFLNFGDKVKIASSEKIPADLYVDTPIWEDLFQQKVSIFIGYGDAVLKAVTVGKDLVEAEVTQGGMVKPSSDLHVPETRQGADSWTWENIDVEKFASLGVDFLIFPGFASKTQVDLFRQRFPKENPSSPWLLQRIDSVGALNQLDQILGSVDGLVISRRELALSANPMSIPMLSKDIVRRCNESAKLALVASEMLGSMCFNVTPTRAEVSDIANAVLDGVDGVVLSEEISRGKYGGKAYDLACTVIQNVEAEGGLPTSWEKRNPNIMDEFSAVAYQALKTARRVKAKALVCITKTGNTALRLGSYHPEIPIIGVTFDQDVSRKISVMRGVTGLALHIDPKIEEVLPAVNDLLKTKEGMEPGDPIVFVTVTLSPVGRSASNLFTVQRIQ